MPVHTTPKTTLLIGMHDAEDGDWMKQNGIKGVCLVLAQVQDQSVPLDFSGLANAGITVLLRVGYGYADGTGTIAPPDKLAALKMQWRRR